MTKTILIVEDEKDILDFIKKFLLDKGYSVITATDGISALEAVEKKQPDLALVDLGLPKLRGESVVTEIRKKHPDIALIILTAKGESTDIVHGFELGADDYIAKPFNPEVLLARIKACFKSKGKDETRTLAVGDLQLNTETFEVKRANKDITLSNKEFHLLHYLMLNKGRVLTRDMILQRIWLTSDYIEPRVVDVYMGYLRKKIDSKSTKKLLRTARGFGYMIKE